MLTILIGLVLDNRKIFNIVDVLYLLWGLSAAALLAGGCSAARTLLGILTGLIPHLENAES